MEETKLGTGEDREGEVWGGREEGGGLYVAAGMGVGRTGGKLGRGIT